MKRLGSNRGRAALVLGLVLIAGASAWAQSSAPPATYFTGQLWNDGVLESGTKDIAFDLWSDPELTDDSAHVCHMDAQEVVIPQDALGSFQLLISQECVSVFSPMTVRWYQLTVDGVEFPRTPIGLVPGAWYANFAYGAQKLFRSVNNGGGVAPSFAPLLSSPCGATESTTGDIEGSSGAVGLAATKELCEEACGNNAAHICLFEDLQRIAVTTGRNPVTPVEEGWIARTSIGPIGCGDDPDSDCGLSAGGLPFTSSAIIPSDPLCEFTTNRGSAWGARGFTRVACDVSRPVLCCD